MEKIAKYILSFFLRKGKPSRRWRDVKTGKFIRRPKMVRVSVGTGISIHSKILRFTKSNIVPEEDAKATEVDLLQKIYDEIETVTDYPMEEWWFYPKIEIGMETVGVENNESE